MLIKYKKQEDSEKKTSEKRNDKNKKEKKNKKTGFDQIIFDQARRRN